MLQERPGDTPDWKSKLAGLDALPGEPLKDMSPAWEKLYARLYKKKHPGKPYWYWVAAACLIFILFILYTPFKTGSPGIVQQHKQPAASPSPRVFKENNPAGSSPVAGNNSTITGLEAPVKKGPTPVHPVVNTPPSLILVKRPVHSMPSSIINTVSPMNPVTDSAGILAIHHPGMDLRKSSLYSDSANVLAIHPATDPTNALAVNSGTGSANASVPVAPKKKLRVIHINEITHPAGEKEVLAGNTNGISVRKDHFTKTYPTSNSSDGILKIKLSPSN